MVGNFIGTDSRGENLANGAGVVIGSSSNTIGGTTASAANVIGFNISEGILVSGTDAAKNVVLGNFIGTDAAGANLGNPIGLMVETPSNTIGGTSTGAANIIGFSASEGIEITGQGASDNLVAGNFIGTNSSGANMGNPVGVSLETGLEFTIGGTSPGYAANVFGFNSTAGLQITGAAATNEVVIGNLFGTNASTANLGNFVGVQEEAGSNTIGGSAARHAGNVFGFNTTRAL